MIKFDDEQINLVWKEVEFEDELYEPHRRDITFIQNLGTHMKFIEDLCRLKSLFTLKIDQKFIKHKCHPF